MNRIVNLLSHIPFGRLDSYHPQLSSRSCDQGPACDIPASHLDPGHVRHHVPGCVRDVPQLDGIRKFEWQQYSLLRFLIVIAISSLYISWRHCHLTDDVCRTIYIVKF